MFQDQADPKRCHWRPVVLSLIALFSTREKIRTMILGGKIAHVGFSASVLVVWILDPHSLDFATWSKLLNLSGSVSLQTNSPAYLIGPCEPYEKMHREQLAWYQAHCKYSPSHHYYY